MDTKESLLILAIVCAIAIQNYIFREQIKENKQEIKQITTILNQQDTINTFLLKISK